MTNYISREDAKEYLKILIKNMKELLMIGGIK